MTISMVNQTQVFSKPAQQLLHWVNTSTYICLHSNKHIAARAISAVFLKVFCHLAQKGIFYYYSTSIIFFFFSYLPQFLSLKPSAALNTRLLPPPPGDSALLVGEGVPGACLLPPPHGSGGALPVARPDDALSLG